MSHEWSTQQTAVFKQCEIGLRTVNTGTGAFGEPAHFIVRARAGTGKTTTIIEGISRMPEGRIIAAAFNTKIKDELAKRLKQSPAAEVKTLHGIGAACVRRYWENVPVEEKKGQRARTLAAAVCGEIAPDPIKRLVVKLLNQAREMAPHAREAGSLVDIGLEFECVPDDEWSSEGYDFAYVEARTLEAMELAATKKPADGIDFADMIFLPVRNRWMPKRYQAGIVDEAQDMSATHLELFLGVVSGRVIVVGDDRQAIYGFRGADSASLDRLKCELRAAELGLTVTYRCARAIVAEAQRLVPDLEAADGNPEGKISYCPSLEHLAVTAKPHDFIISRTNAPLAKVAMTLIRKQTPVKIMGRKIGEGLIDLVKKLAVGHAAQSTPAFLRKLTVWEEREVDRTLAAGREERVPDIRDRAETLRVVSEGITGPRELEARLWSIFADDPVVGSVTCTSVHKAKGLEADRCFVLVDTLYPSAPPVPKGRPEPSDEVIARRQLEERNIEYVAITRAKRELTWVSGK